jgi:hypothetical protein
LRDKIPFWLAVAGDILLSWRFSGAVFGEACGRDRFGWERAGEDWPRFADAFLNCDEDDA